MVESCAARADAAEAGADVEAGERQEEARAAEQRDDGDQICRPGEQQTAAEGRHQRGSGPGTGKHDVGNDTEQPRRAFRQHHILAHQPDQIEIGL